MEKESRIKVVDKTRKSRMNGERKQDKSSRVRLEKLG